MEEMQRQTYVNGRRDGRLVCCQDGTYVPGRESIMSVQEGGMDMEE